MGALLRNIWHGAQLTLFLGSKREYFQYGKWQAAWLVFTLLLVAGIPKYYKAGLGAQLNTYALPGFLLTIAISLVAYYIVSRFLGRDRAGELIVVGLSASVFVSVVSVGYNYYTESFPVTSKSGFVVASAIQILLLIWAVIVECRVFRLIYAVTKKKALFFAVLVYAFVIALYAFLALDQDLFWPENNEEPVSAYDSVNLEDTYYSQPRLLSDAINRLDLHTTGESDLYLVTFASYGEQDVFKKEIEFVKQRVEEKYGNAGKTIRLINHLDTIDTDPLANAPNLQAVLNGVRGKMSIEEDMLMLYLTSHGSKNAELSSWFWPINPNPINATSLHQMLDKSGIKWRIVIVSACYAGSFIDLLKDENTMIITASSAENTSFGCSNDRELTYFAEAMFKHAWTQSDSIEEVFEIAKQWVTEKENSEDKTPSEPQIFIGKNIETMISEKNY